MDLDNINCVVKSRTWSKFPSETHPARLTIKLIVSYWVLRR